MGADRVFLARARAGSRHPGTPGASFEPAWPRTPEPPAHSPRWLRRPPHPPWDTPACSAGSVSYLPPSPPHAAARGAAGSPCSRGPSVGLSTRPLEAPLWLNVPRPSVTFPGLARCLCPVRGRPDPYHRTWLPGQPVYGDEHIRSAFGSPAVTAHSRRLINL